MEGDAPVNAPMLAGEGGHRGNASNADQDQVLLRRRLAAERELNTMGVALTASAFFLLMSTVRAIAEPPAWVTKARETGDHHYKACFYRVITTIAYADVVGMVTVLSLYQAQVKAVLAERALAVVEVSVQIVIACNVMLLSVHITDGWRGAVALFVAVVVGPPVMVLFCMGELSELKKVFLKIGKMFGF